MADFSRAEYSKNHKASFDAAIISTRKYLEELETEYTNIWNELETLRKERAALIENAIKVLKDNNIKLGKQLCRCNNEELNVELEKSLGQLGFRDLEEIRVSIVKINMRYDKIQELSLGLIRISDELSKFRSPEKDHDEEVIIDFRAAKKSRQEKLKEKVMSTKDETPEEVIVEEEKVEEDTTKEKTKEEHVMSTIIEESDLQTMLENTKLESDLTAEIDDLMEIFMDKEETLSIKEETPEEIEEDKQYIDALMEKDMTLSSVAGKVYENPEYWKELYKYGNNAGKINRRAAELGLTVEEVCTKKGKLEGLVISFPTELETYEARDIKN